MYMEILSFFFNTDYLTKLYGTYSSFDMYSFNVENIFNVFEDKLSKHINFKNGKK